MRIQPKRGDKTSLLLFAYHFSFVFKCPFLQLSICRNFFIERFFQHIYLYSFVFYSSFCAVFFPYFPYLLIILIIYFTKFGARFLLFFILLKIVNIISSLIIGYGHAVPKTNAGKFLTIIYALVGIPLVFLYLTNIGDYLASLFRALYAKICRRCCEGSCGYKAEPYSKMSVFNALRVRPSETDLTERMDFLLDESLHRNNINIIRRVGVGKEVQKNMNRKQSATEYHGLNVTSNDHVIEMEQMEYRNRNEKWVK